MDEKTIREQYSHINSLLEAKRLKEALTQLESLLWQCSDWTMRTRLEQLQTSYKYMLEYMRQGAQDPERPHMYQKLITDTWELAEQTRLIMLDSISSKYYHEVRRTPRSADLSNYDLKTLFRILESFNDNSVVSEFLSEAEIRKAMQRHEHTLKFLFLQTWTNSAWTAQEGEDAQAMLTSQQLTTEDVCLYVSAVMLSLMECFDLRKTMWLLDAYKYPHIHVSQRALVSVLIIFHLYRNRIGLYPELTKRIELMAEHPTFNKDIACIYRQLLLCQETEKIDKKMREEIIPEMIKGTSPYLRMGMEANEDESNDKNPDWENVFEKSGLSDKLREMNDLQMEGADVYMSSFSGLKNYPFFKEVANWFYPFTKQQSEVHKLIGSKNKNNSVLDLILQSGFFSNSDKYSLFFTIQHLPSTQRDMMLSQLSEQKEAQLAEGMNIDQLTKFNQRSDIISNQYLHDLYRFFRLNVRRQEFRDFFKEKIDLHRIPILKDVLYWEDVLSSIADFHLKKERWEEATEVYKELEKMEGFGDNAAGYYQKLGFTFQKRKMYAEAIEAYLKAETLKADNVWNNRHLATCYRLTRNFKAALTYYKRVEEAMPENANITFYIGNCLVELEQYEEALNYFFKLDFMENNCIKAWRGIGWCSFVGRKYEQAMRYYEKTIEQKPLAIDYMNAGHVAWAMGDIQKAITFYGKSVTLCENREQFLSMFHKDKEPLLQQGIKEEDVPLMLDLLN